MISERAPLLAALALALALFGCGGGRGIPTVSRVAPAQAYTDTAVPLYVHAANARPAFTVDLGGESVADDPGSLRLTLLPEAGADVVPLPNPRWTTDGRLITATPVGLAAGRYALELVDPRGERVLFPNAFESLGPDLDAPLLMVRSPDPYAYLQQGKPAKAEVVASDTPGMLAAIDWTSSDGSSGSCALPSPDPEDDLIRPTETACTITFPVPPLGDADPTAVPFWIEIKARDLAGHETMVSTPLNAAKGPSILAFFDTVGALGGYQPFIVTGRNFVRGSKAYIDGTEILGAALGGETPDMQSIIGWTPPHDRAQQVSVEVRSPAGTAFSPGSFTYADPPLLRDVEPRAGPTAGGIRVTVRGNGLRTGVLIYFGASEVKRRPLTSVLYQPDNKVVGCLPPGTGTVSVWAYDAVTGDSELAGAFTYDDTAPLPPPPPTGSDCP